jgi:hypothetical protein
MSLLTKQTSAFEGKDSCTESERLHGIMARALAATLSQCLLTSAMSFPNDAVLCREMNF